MRKNLQFKAWILLVVFTAEIFVPASAFALGSGPSQPEMASFTPAGTSEMVDPFTGDFSYNIPLMDVEGYPINIAYNSGVTMEQDASWVGLGWNLNIGAVTRSVRGLPDDFKGEEITTSTNIKDMVISKVGGGIGTEVFGYEGLGIDLSLDLSFVKNNYKGFGIVFEPSLGISISNGGLQMSGNKGLSLNTLDGASINSSLGVAYEGLNKQGKGFSLGLSKNSGYNTRTGQEYISFGTTAGYTQKGDKYMNRRTDVVDSRGGASLGGSSTYLPIGLESYVPYPSIEMYSKTISYSGSVGGAFLGGHGSASLHGSKTTQSMLNPDGVSGASSKIKVKPAYGYLYTEDATDEDLKDFNREKSVVLNNSIQNLSPTNFTYDVYSVSGHGVSGTFRPFRNDIGMLFDPVLGKKKNSDADEVGAEYGLGQYFHGGGNFNTTDVTSEYGKWHGGAHSNYNFIGNQTGSLHESYYLKAAGDLAETDIEYFNEKIGGTNAVAFQLNGMTTNNVLINQDGTPLPAVFPLNTLNTKRKARSKHLAFFTAEESNDIHGNTSVESYSGSFIATNSNVNSTASVLYTAPLSKELVDRIDADKKAHHVAEVVQTNTEGERFVFGIAAYNNFKEERYFATESNVIDNWGRVEPIGSSSVTVGSTSNVEDSEGNQSGVDNFFSKKAIPAYAHSYLLTEKQSSDYADVTGDGVSSDDMGNAWKFNYTRTSDAYTWRMPYANANLDKGFESNTKDDKASYSYGEKELWYTHSVESKNQVAEFIISPRKDGIAAAVTSLNSSVPQLGTSGVINKLGGKPAGVLTDEQKSFQLDKIVLYDKYDRITNGDDAIPIKTVEFFYDYELCKGIENHEDYLGAVVDGINPGKLTLRSIEISYGNDNEGKESPYQFTYSGENDGSGTPVGGINPDYNPLKSDRWGNFKDYSANPSGIQNKFFPYVIQDKSITGYDPDDWASAWNLKQIITPSYGKITVNYEADEYAYVQDKPAMQMFPVLGATNQTTEILPNTGATDYLYGKNRIYIKKPVDLPTGLSKSELKERFFGSNGQLQDLFFRFKTEVRSGVEDYVSGYVTAVDIDYENAANPTMLYVDLVGSKNPISLATMEFYRENLFEILYDQPNIDDTDLESFVKGVRANKDDIRQMFTGVEANLREKGTGNRFIPEESFIRLNSPTQTKIGGGHRVQSIVMSDNWSQMSPDANALDRTYGQHYEYTEKDDQGNIISSGVATYEPIIGNDENPWKTPVPYVLQSKKGHIPAINSFEETPFGETFFPSARVGYSKVKVTNIHSDKGETSNLITENTFYTAKDFPCIVKQTELSPSQKFYDPGKDNKYTLPYINNKSQSRFAASQGYSIILNDMHGKPLKVESYTLIDHPLILDKKIKKIVSGVKYNYQYNETAEGKELDNAVDVISENGTVQEKLLGVEYDVVMDSRYSYNKTQTISSKANLDIIPGIPVPVFAPPSPPVVIPMLYGNGVSDVKEVKTVVVTKVVQMYGIIESIKSYTDQYATTLTNKLYDGLTGRVLLTEATDEHQQNEFQFTIPAYLTEGLQRMGASYENHGLEIELVPESNLDCNAYGTDDYFVNPGKLMHGDEVLVTDASGNVSKAFVDVNFLVTNTCDNGKDPKVISPECSEFNWAFYEVSPIYGAICDGPFSYVTSVNPPPHLKNLEDKFNLGEVALSETILYPMKGQLADFYNNPIPDRINFPYPISEQGAINLTFCQEFSVLSNGNPSIFRLRTWNNAVNGFRSSDINSFGVDQFFDLNDPIKMEPYKTPISGQNNGGFKFSGFFFDLNETCDNRVIENQEDIVVNNHDRLFLLKSTFTDLVTPFASEEAYYIVDRSDWGQSAPVSEISSQCPTTFRLLDESGNHILNLAAGDKLKVIRSGNRNMLNADEGQVVAAADPVKYTSITINSTTALRFDGVKTATEVDLFQITGVEYSDTYEVENNRFTSTTNKFKIGSDSKFKVVKTHKYNASRSQNTNQVELANDGKFVNSTNSLLPALWSRSECTGLITSPFKQDEGNWRTEEEIVTYNKDGVAVEAKNALDIYSAVHTNNTGQVKAVVSNSTKASAGFESFEDYKVLVQSREIKNNFNWLSNLTQTNYSIGGDDYRIPTLTADHEKVLVKGVAHTGNYSIFLRGENNDIDLGTGTILPTFDFKEYTVQSLISKTLGHENPVVVRSESLAGYPYAPLDVGQMETDFRDQFESGSATRSEIEAAIGKPQGTVTALTYNGLNELTYRVSHHPEAGFDPDIGKYYFSVWVKEILPHNPPFNAFKGSSPHVKIQVGTNIAQKNQINSVEIDGWHQITGEFDYLDPTEDIAITLDGGLWGAFFDDIRVHPSQSNMTTYVYDASTQRLKAQLDENNYATFYEYNQEGILSQVKKETNSGILTVSESRQGTHRH